MAGENVAARCSTGSSVRRRHAQRSLGAALVCAGLLGATAAHAASLPRLQANGGVVQLMVDDKPWIALAGEVHNSTASSAAYMAPVWDRLAELHLNTVVTPVYWELVEPQEGRFDFDLLDEQIRQARTRDMRIVLLWFGAIKNAKSTYAPSWVLADRDRFPRAETRPSSLPFAKGPPPLSVFGEATRTADARAFARLLEHLSQTDAGHTVIAVQVENETGVLGDSRDRSPAAEEAWTGEVPADLLDHLASKKGRLSPSLETLWRQHGYRMTGTWEEVFGADWQADEVFMAWGVSRFVDGVAAAGKSRLALPMYANAWLGPQKASDPAGAWPSGGPVPRVFDIWRAGAPHIDWLSPDIYVDDFAGWAAAYARPDNPLFIPEARFNVGNLFLALGQYRAFGFSPFGIENGLPDSQVAQAYALLQGMLPLLAGAQANGAVTGFALAPGATHEVRLGDYVVRVRSQREALRAMFLDMGIPIPIDAPPPVPQTVGFGPPELTDQRALGLVLQLSADEFLVLGQDLNLSFEMTTPGDNMPEVVRIQEGHYAEGVWIPGRVLNGDERLRIVPFDSLGMAMIRLIRP